MKTTTILFNSVLALGLAVAGSAFAADAPATTQVQDRAAIQAEHRAATANMTQEERDAYRAQKQSEMTAEQRAAMRASKGGANKGQGVKARDGSGAGSKGGAGGGQGAGR